MYPLTVHLCPLGVELFMINNVRRHNMVTKSKRSPTTKYKNYTPTQLSTISRKCQKKVLMASLTPIQKIAIKRELKWIAFYLRAATIQQINVKLKTLKTQMAKHYGVTVSSPKATSAAIKRLTLKLNQIQRCARVSALIKLCSDVKVSSYTNPKTNTTKTSTAKYKNQAKSLKKELSKLKQRNAAMKKLVAKFRKEVDQLQRHYGTFHQQKPRLVHSRHTKKVGQDVSNIVRFSNALSNAFTKQLHHNAG